ncbi:transaldolase/EF-hand domain-containing protein [Pseudobythopirellula maris]|uniref:Transaldolase/EF-hand domain-containing protein n=1 Tax=Pseudobythopirellula maris TaxID=2527991 RepID=A0A5C5ZU14_9BACT|nr:hypothetical protein [Pseudobythopirellula maris]TWT90508.1 transaldolase/EF-hand domain-containing protein [Pseudobythopirellula maris]
MRIGLCLAALMLATGCSKPAPPPDPTPPAVDQAAVDQAAIEELEEAAEDEAPAADPVPEVLAAPSDNDTAATPEPATADGERTAAETTPDLTSEPEPAPANRVVILTPEGPMLVDVRITLDGRPHGSGVDRLVEFVLAAADMDGDGYPSWEELAVNEALLSGPIGRSAGAAPNADDFDADRDGRVDRAEARSWLRGGAGAAALRLTSSRAYAIDPRRSPVWRVLDSDSSGALSAAEIESAPTRLARRDVNDNLIIERDELLSLADVIASRDPNAAMQGPADYGGDHHAALLLESSDDAQRFGYAATLLYGKGRWLTPSGFGRFASLHRELDAGGDGTLSDSDWREVTKAPAPASLHIDFGLGEGDGIQPFQPPRLELLPSDRAPIRAETMAPNAALVAIGGGELFFAAVDEAPQGNATAEAAELFARLDSDENGYVDAEEAFAAEQIGGLFEAYDQDGDGRLDSKDIESLLLLGRAASASQVRVVAHDRGDALFARLDQNGDGRLGEREVAETPQRLAEIDTNDDGGISLPELPWRMTFACYRTARDLGGFEEPAVVRSAENTGETPDWFAGGDLNGDGDLSRQEFFGPISRFDRLDHNGDGFLDATEAIEHSSE